MSEDQPKPPGGDDLYELDLPEDDEPTPPAASPIDLSSDVDAAVEVPSREASSAPASEGASAGLAAGGQGPQVSEALYKHEGDPAFVDPEVARMRREDQRVAAAEQAATEAAAKRTRHLIIGGAVLVAAAIGYVLYRVAF